MRAASLASDAVIFNFRPLPVVQNSGKISVLNSFFYVSSMGANSNVSNSYLRNKGQVEDELVKLKFTKLAILRPSLLLGNRKSFR